MAERTQGQYEFKSLSPLGALLDFAISSLAAFRGVPLRRQTNCIYIFPKLAFTFLIEFSLKFAFPKGGSAWQKYAQGIPSSQIEKK